MKYNRVFSITMALVIFGFLVVNSAYAEDWNIIQLTDNSYTDTAPQVYGSNVVWQGRGPDGADWEIFLYDGNTTTQLTNNSSNEERPQVYGSNVVWQSYDGNDSEIFLATIPEPATMSLLIIGGLAMLKRKRK